MLTEHGKKGGNDMGSTFSTQAEVIGILERDLMLQEGGERLHRWFSDLMITFVAHAKKIIDTQGIQMAQSYVAGVEKILFSSDFLKRFPRPADLTWIKTHYKKSVESIGLRMEMGTRQEIPFKTEKPSYILDKQPPRYENMHEAVEIGGGKTIRYAGAE